jgi:hypothetical protein
LKRRRTISALNSLTLSPALAALLLKPHDAPKDWLTRAMDAVLGPFFRWFDRSFKAGARKYEGAVARVLDHKTIALIVYLVLIGLTWFAFQKVPQGFVPSQDKQYLVGFAQLPDGATLDRTEDVIRRMSDIALKQPGVESAVAFPGLSISGFTNSSNAGIVFVTLKPFAERKSPDLSGGAIAGQLNQKFSAIPEAFTAMFPPPPVQGLGTTGGFKLQLEDRGGLGYEALDQAVKAFMAKAYQTPELAGMFSSYQVNVPQLYADVDRAKARQLDPQRVPGPAQDRGRRRDQQWHAEPRAPPAQDSQRLALRTGRGPVTSLHDRDLLAGDRRDRRAQPVHVVEPHVGQHRDPAVPGVRRVQASAKAHLDQRDVRRDLREVPEHHRGQQLELRWRPQARGDPVGQRQDLLDQAGEGLGRDRPAVHDDPLPVRHEVGLGRLSHAIAGGPEGGPGERDDAALAVRPGDERAAHLELRVPERTQQGADPAEPEADPVSAAGLERGERGRVAHGRLAGGRPGRAHSRVSSSS